MTIALWILASLLIIVTLPGTVEILWLTTGAILARLKKKP